MCMHPSGVATASPIRLLDPLLTINVLEIRTTTYLARRDGMAAVACNSGCGMNDHGWCNSGIYEWHACACQARLDHFRDPLLLNFQLFIVPHRRQRRSLPCGLAGRGVHATLASGQLPLKGGIRTTSSLLTKAACYGPLDLKRPAILHHTTCRPEASNALHVTPPLTPADCTTWQ